MNLRLASSFSRFPLAGLSLALFAAGCQMAQMAVPRDLESTSDSFACKGRSGFVLSERFEFGPYAVTDVSRGWTKRFMVGVAGWEHARAGQKYEYAMTAPNGARWQGVAATGIRQNDIKTAVWGGELVWGLTTDINFVTRLGLETGDTPWTLLLGHGSRENLLKGILTDGQTQFQVEGTHELKGSSIPLLDTAGYLFSRDGRPVAAVDLLNEGAVRLSRSLTPDEKNLIAAAAVSLLLYKDLSER